VDVAGLFCDGSDGSYTGCTVDRGDYVSFDLPIDGGSDNVRNGRFGYRFLGTTPAGVTVLEYVGNTGGSGTILGVVFVKFELQRIGYTATDAHDRLVMRFLGAESWGDRVHRDVTLVGNELRLGPEKSDIPAAQDSLEQARVVCLQ
jgi:hypothetical protein